MRCYIFDFAEVISFSRMSDDLHVFGEPVGYPPASYLVNAPFCHIFQSQDGLQFYYSRFCRPCLFASCTNFVRIFVQHNEPPLFAKKSRPGQKPKRAKKFS